MKNFSCRNNKVCQTNLPIKFEKEKLLFPIVTESHKMRPKWDCCGPTFLANNVQTSWWFFKDSWFKVFSSLAPHIMTLGFSSCWCVKRLHLIFFSLLSSVTWTVYMFAPWTEPRRQLVGFRLNFAWAERSLHNWWMN